jgi:adenylate cyclase
MHTDRARDLEKITSAELSVVLVCDLVESVQWMEHDEEDAVSRWQAYSKQVRDVISPRFGGSVIKSTGDGIMIEFSSARSAVLASNELHAAAESANQPFKDAHQMRLRTGIHETVVHRDQYDLYGHGVNLAARITALAQPCETVISAPVRDRLTDFVDGDIEDLGDCFLKHVTEPQRVYRIGPPRSGSFAREHVAHLQPSIAVIPFTARSHEPQDFAIGELIADGVLERLSRTPSLRVISRLSSSPFRDRGLGLESMQTHLAVNFVVSGSYLVINGKMLVNVELTEVLSGEIYWSARCSNDVADLLLLESECCHLIADGVHKAIVDKEVQKALVHPIPNLAGYTLLLGGISLMHRSSTREFQRSREALDTLADRYGKNASVRAWIGKWHVLRVVRGISPNPQLDAQLALDATRRAQDLEPSNAFALSIHGHALCHLSGDPEAAINRIDDAILLNPNESIAWLYKSVWSSMWGRLQDAVSEAERAKMLSPLDPMSYYYDMILTGAYAFAGRYEEAIVSGKKSLRQNKHHAPTLRVLLLAQFEGGYLDDALGTLNQLVLESPNLSISSYLKMGGKESQARQRVASAFRALGLPEV